MKKSKRVKIIACRNKHHWYDLLIGTELDVIEIKDENDGFPDGYIPAGTWRDFGFMYKQDVEIISEGKRAKPPLIIKKDPITPMKHNSYK